MPSTLFGQPATPATIQGDVSPYTMSVMFSPSAACTAQAIWFYSAPSAAVLPQDITIYQVTAGTPQVASQAASWSGAAGSGWVRAPFTSPPSLTSGAFYKACVSQLNGGSGNWYSATTAYWSSGPGASGITSGILAAPNNSAAAAEDSGIGVGSTGQDSFHSSSSVTYPDAAAGAANYWVDVEIQASAAEVDFSGSLTVTPALTGSMAVGVPVLFSGSLSVTPVLSATLQVSSPSGQPVTQAGPGFTHPVLMTALTRLYQSVWAGRLPDVLPGGVFWADSSDSPNLISSGAARLWNAGDPPAPNPEPAWTANQIPGFGAGTSNSSPA